MTTEAHARTVVWQRSGGGRCEVCGRPGHSIQHRVKRSQGGTWDPGNLIRVCGDGTRYCHGWIEAHPTHAMTLGLWVPGTIDPLTVPMWLHPSGWWRGWWYADHDGCWTWTDDPDPTPDTTAAIAAITTARLS